MLAGAILLTTIYKKKFKSKFLGKALEKINHGNRSIKERLEHFGNDLDRNYRFNKRV